MKKYLLAAMSILFVSHSIFPAMFTIENYTGSDIAVTVKLDKSWGSPTIEAKIMNGGDHTFNTGIHVVPRGGISWELEGDNYSLSHVYIDKPLMIGGVIRLFKTGTYEFKFRDGRSGYGNIQRD